MTIVEFDPEDYDDSTLSDDLGYRDYSTGMDGYFTIDVQDRIEIYRDEKLLLLVEGSPSITVLLKSNDTIRWYERTANESSQETQNT